MRLGTRAVGSCQGRTARDRNRVRLGEQRPHGRLQRILGSRAAAHAPRTPDPVSDAIDLKCRWHLSLPRACRCVPAACGLVPSRRRTSGKAADRDPSLLSPKMKTKRRHELETNELADWLGQTYRSLLPYANHLLWGAVILVAIVLGVTWLLRSWRAQNRDASALLSAALAPRAFGMAPEQQLDAQRQDFQSVADEYPDSIAGQWAHLLAADTYREEGMRRFTMDRDGALAALRKAEQEYRELIKHPTGMELLDERALLGRAKALESLDEIKEARKLYTQLLERHPPEEITVDSQSGQPEELDYYLARRFKDDPPEDLLGAIRAGLVEVQGQSGWQVADRYTQVEPGTKLRVQFAGLHTLDAKQRLNAINKDDVVRFYEWIETAEAPPLPALPKTPSTGTGQPGEEKGIIPEFAPEPGQAAQPQAQPDASQPKPDQPKEQPKPNAPSSEQPQAKSAAQPGPATPSQPVEAPKPDAGKPEAPQTP